MKIRIIVIIGLLAFSAFAGTVCFEIPPAHTQRVADAFGASLRLVDANGAPRPATQAEVTKAVQDYIQSVTQNYERQKNAEAFVPSPVPVTATPVGGSPTAAALKKK